jgi:C_GCAxxG_C_C family probable redox protein
MKSRVDQAEENFRNGYNCAQAVLAAYAPTVGIAPDIALRITAGMGGGMGRLQEVCGAVSASFLVLGSRLAAHSATDPATKDLVYAQVQEFARQFRSLHGTINCRELLKCDLNTEEGRNEHARENQRELICMHCVRNASEILDRMLDEQQTG